MFWLYQHLSLPRDVSHFAGPLPLVSILAGAAPSRFGHALHPCGHLRYGRAGLPDHVAPKKKGQWQLWKAVEMWEWHGNIPGISWEYDRSVGISWEISCGILDKIWDLPKKDGDSQMTIKIWAAKTGDKTKPIGIFLWIALEYIGIQWANCFVQEWATRIFNGRASFSLLTLWYGGNNTPCSNTPIRLGCW